jgi:hypothetical protein
MKKVNVITGVSKVQEMKDCNDTNTFGQQYDFSDKTIDTNSDREFDPTTGWVIQEEDGNGYYKDFDSYYNV